MSIEFIEYDPETIGEISTKIDEIKGQAFKAKSAFLNETHTYLNTILKTTYELTRLINQGKIVHKEPSELISGA